MGAHAKVCVRATFWSVSPFRFTYLAPILVVFVLKRACRAIPFFNRLLGRICNRNAVHSGCVANSHGMHPIERFIQVSTPMCTMMNNVTSRFIARKAI